MCSDKQNTADMNNFYDDVFDMVPFESPNLAVEQLSVQENGDVGVDGSLSVGGAVYVNKWATIASDGLPLIYTREDPVTPQPTTWMSILLWQVVLQDKRIRVFLQLPLEEVFFSMLEPTSSSQPAVRLFSSPVCSYIDSPGTGTYLSFFGAQPFDPTKGGAAQVPAAQMDVQGGTPTTPNQGTINMYACRTNFHGDVFIDPGHLWQ